MLFRSGTDKDSPPPRPPPLFFSLVDPNSLLQNPGFWVGATGDGRGRAGVKRGLDQARSLCAVGPDQGWSRYRCPPDSLPGQASVVLMLPAFEGGGQPPAPGIIPVLWWTLQQQGNALYLNRVPDAHSLHTHTAHGGRTICTHVYMSGCTETRTHTHTHEHSN